MTAGVVVCGGSVHIIRWYMHERSDIRQSILDIVKRERAVSIVRLAELLGVTYEAIRQHMIAMEEEGWIARRVVRSPDHTAADGRPAATYSLTRDGEHRFAKRYDELAAMLVASVVETAGDDALHAVLGAITDARVRQWEPLLRGRTLDRRVELLRGFYVDGDPYMESASEGEDVALVEHNCPYLDVAMRHPEICSTTVTALARLVGCAVVREERFQNGDGRCRFRFLLDTTVDPSERGFRREPSA